MSDASAPALGRSPGDGAGAGEDVDRLVQLGRALSDPSRVRVLLVLAVEGEQRVGELVARLRLPQPAASHHLGILRDFGLLRQRRAGRQVYYRLAEPPEGGAASPPLRLVVGGVAVTVG